MALDYLTWRMSWHHLWTHCQMYPCHDHQRVLVPWLPNHQILTLISSVDHAALLLCFDIPRRFATSRASSGVFATWPRGALTPYLRKRSTERYSWILRKRFCCCWTGTRAAYPLKSHEQDLYIYQTTWWHSWTTPNHFWILPWWHVQLVQMRSGMMATCEG